MIEQPASNWKKMSRWTPSPAWRFALLVFLVMRVGLGLLLLAGQFAIWGWVG